MDRRLKTSVPQTDSMLVPRWSYLEKFRESEKQYKIKQKENFDSKHRGKELPPISNDTEVWITTEPEPFILLLLITYYFLWVCLHTVFLLKIWPRKNDLFRASPNI